MARGRPRAAVFVLAGAVVAAVCRAAVPAGAVSAEVPVSGVLARALVAGTALWPGRRRVAGPGVRYKTLCVMAVETAALGARAMARHSVPVRAVVAGAAGSAGMPRRVPSGRKGLGPLSVWAVRHLRVDLRRDEQKVGVLLLRLVGRRH